MDRHPEGPALRPTRARTNGLEHLPRAAAREGPVNGGQRTNRASEDGVWLFAWAKGRYKRSKEVATESKEETEYRNRNPGSSIGRPDGRARALGRSLRRKGGVPLAAKNARWLGWREAWKILISKLWSASRSKSVGPFSIAE